MDSKSSLVVDGFIFGSPQDAEIAREEVQKIQYLDEKMNYQNIGRTKSLYDKAVNSKTFQTPIGWTYLMNLRNHLVRSGVPEEELLPVPLYTVFVHEEEKAPRVRVRAAKRGPTYRKQFATSLLVNFFLVILLIGMLVIALRSETPNMINYRNAIVNEYAGWEQDLKEREQEIRQKEMELKGNTWNK